MELETIANSLINVFSGSPLSNGIKIILSIIVIGMLWWYRRQKVKIASEQTAKERARDQGAISDKNAKISKKSKSAEDEIEEL